MPRRGPTPEAARKSILSKLFLLLTLFTSSESYFIQLAAPCQLGVCAFPGCYVPRVPHARWCRTLTLCVKHCDCYRALRDGVSPVLGGASAISSGAGANASGAGASASGASASGAGTSAGAGASASASTASAGAGASASASSVSAGAGASASASSVSAGAGASASASSASALQHDAPAELFALDDEANDDWPGCMQGGDDDRDDYVDSLGDGAVSDGACERAAGSWSVQDHYYNLLTRMVDVVRPDGRCDRGLSGVRALNASLFAVNDFELVDLHGHATDDLDAAASVLLVNRVCHVLLHAVNLTGDDDASFSPVSAFVLLCDCCDRHSEFIASSLLNKRPCNQPYASVEQLIMFIRQYEGDALGDGSFGQLRVEDCLHTVALRKLLFDARFSQAPGIPVTRYIDYATTSLAPVVVCFHADARSFSVFNGAHDRFPALVRVHHGALRCSERQSCHTANCIHVRTVQAISEQLPGSLLALCTSVPPRGLLHNVIDDELKPQCQSFRFLPFDSDSPGPRRPSFGVPFLREPRHLTCLVPDGTCLCVSAGAVAAAAAAASVVGAVASESDDHTVGTSAALAHCASCHTRCPDGHAWGKELVEVTSSARIVTFDRGVIKGVKVYSRRCSVASCMHDLVYDGQQDGYLAVSPTEIWDLRVLYAHGDSVPTTGATFHDLAVFATVLANQLPTQRDVTIDRATASRAFWAFLSLLEEPPLSHQECVVCGPPSKVSTWILDGTNVGTLRELCNIDADDRGETVINANVSPEDLYLFRCPELRVLMETWLAIDGLSEQQWKRLRTLTRVTESALFLSGLLPTQYTQRCPTHWRPFFEALASQSVSYALLCGPLKMQPILSALAGGAVFTQEYHGQLLLSMPELVKLLTGGSSLLATLGQPVDGRAVPLLAALVASIDRVKARAAAQPDLDMKLGRQPVSLSDDIAYGHSFHPDLRHRFVHAPRFARDDPRAPPLDDPSSCRHAMNKGSKWASVHTEFVCVHGVSYGSSTVPERESLRAMYQTLRERFGGDAELNLTYDYGCGLGRYMYYRDPAWALKQNVKIDRFHSAGHKNCSPAYTFKYNSSPSVATINTSAAEQRNALTARVERPVRFMTGLHAVLFLAFVRTKQNKVKNDKIRRSKSYVSLHTK